MMMGMQQPAPVDRDQQPASDAPLAGKIIGSVVAMGLNERLQLNSGEVARDRRDRRGKNDGTSPPMPLPPEPSPPPPPVPRLPEPSPPQQLTALQFTLASSDQFSLSESDNPFQLRPPEAPSLLLHSMVSMLSACAMLVLACSLRAQTRRARLRPVGVVMARPVLQVYGYLASEEDEMHAAVEVGGSGGSAGNGGGGGREAASLQPVAAIAPAAETIEVAIATGPSSSWRNWQVRATPLEAGAPVAVGHPVARAAARTPPPAAPNSNEDETATTPI